MISDKKALENAIILSNFCKEQRGCQNCIFRKFGAGQWKCHVGEPEWWDIDEIARQVEAKRRNNGYL